MKLLKVRSSTLDSNFKDGTAYFHVILLNYRHIRVLYGSKSCCKFLSMMQRVFFMVGFSFVSSSHDEFLLSIDTRSISSDTDISGLVEALLLYFTTVDNFGRDFVFTPVLSIREVDNFSAMFKDVSLVVPKLDGNIAYIAPPKMTMEWRASYEMQLTLSQCLLSDLEKGRLKLVLQPISRCSVPHVFSYEALLRSETGFGLGGMERTIAALEETGLVRVLDRYVVSAVIGRLREDSSVVISCNVSAVSYCLDCWWLKIFQILKNSPDLASRLIVELTEGSEITDYAVFLDFANALRSLGVRLALDDFGGGVSRISTLTNFRFDYVKFDKSVLRRISAGSLSTLMVSEAVNCFKLLGSEVVVEGVECAKDLTIVRDIGCDYVQGFYVAYPSSEKHIKIESVGDDYFKKFGLPAHVLF